MSVPKTLVRAWLTLRYQILGRRYRRLVIEHVHGAPLIILPDVFNPKLFRTGEVLARAVAEYPALEGARVLDLGAGSGIGAVFAARRAACVVAVDINPEAVRCARLNCLLNRVEDRVDVRQGDLFAPVAGERFDVVLFNPPFYRGRPRDAFDHAWRGEDIFERFAAGLSAVMNGGGSALVVLSSDGEEAAALAALRANGLEATPLVRRDYVNEIVTVFRAVLRDCT